MLKSKTVIALEKMIKVHEDRIKIFQRQLQDHESGEAKLSRVMKASTENHLEESKTILKEKKAKLKELMMEDQRALEEKEKIEEMLQRQIYLENQPDRIQQNRNATEAEKFEAMMLLDELPKEIWFEDEDLIDIASQIIKLNLRNVEDALDKYITIKAEFDNLITALPEDKPKELGVLNTHIPITVVHFWTLVESIKKEMLKKDENAKFKGLPKYEDWWIRELWGSHQAYFGLFKWKAIVASLCITVDQKKAWNSIFDNWMMLKKLLNSKGSIAYDYNVIFDELLAKYVELEEEFDLKNLKAMEIIIKRITAKENFTTVIKGHSIITPYLKWKMDRIKSKEEADDAAKRKAANKETNKKIDKAKK